MNALLLVFLLLFPPQNASVTHGELQVLADPGLDVLIDGTHYGVTGPGGIVLSVPEGQRKVTVRSSNGAENTFQVTISSMTPAELRVSALGLKRPLKRPQTGGVAIRKATGCSASSGTFSAENSGGDLYLSSLPVGDHTIVVNCGDRTVRTTASVKVGYLTTFDLDRNARTLRRTGEERMSLSVEVLENSAIAQSSIPADWKRALSRITVPGVRVEGAVQLSVDRMRVVAYAKDIRSASQYQYRLQNAQDIQKVESCRTTKRQDGYGVDAILRMFPVARQ
jgi:hypothetical protein